MSAKALVVVAVLGLTHAGAWWKATAVERTAQALVASEKRNESFNALVDENAKVHEAESKLNALKNKQEISDAAAQKTTADLSGQLHGARLRDQNAVSRCASNGGTPSPASVSADHGSEAGGVLSTQLTGLLQKLTREADEVNLAYASCRADGESIRKIN